MRQIRYFGRMYDHNDDSIYEMADFQDILDQTDPAEGGNYDMQSRMKMVEYNREPDCVQIVRYFIMLSLHHYARICC